MSYEGAVEFLSQARVGGWVAFNAGGTRLVPKVVLRFRTLGNFSPTAVPERPGGIKGFVFDLPPQFQDLGWAEFLEEFDGVHAEHRAPSGAQYWIVPLYKSVLAGFDPKNPTALLAEKLNPYKISPRPGGRIAVFTMAYNEPLFLPLWARYYAGEFGAENLYVIDHGSAVDYRASLPEGVNLVRIPRDEFDHWLLARMAALFQRFLLESYDSVLYTDADEFVGAAPEVRQGRTLRHFLLELPEPIGMTRGYTLNHDVLREPAYDPSRPVLQQRRFMTYTPVMDKPLVSRVPLNWLPGFHQAREGGTRIRGVYMLHLRWFDLDEALRKAANYRASKWNPHDLQHRFAEYQRDEEEKVIRDFRSWSEPFANMDEAQFDEVAEITVVPDWMREAISI